MTHDPLRTTGVPRRVALIVISIWGVFMDRRFILGLCATALTSVPVIPDIAMAQGKSFKDQLVGTWIYVSSTGKRDDGSAVDRPPAQGAVTYTAGKGVRDVLMRHDIESGGSTALAENISGANANGHRSAARDPVALGAGGQAPQSRPQDHARARPRGKKAMDAAYHSWARP